MREEKCKIISNTVVEGNYYLMKVESEYVAKNSNPGSFVMIEVSKGNDPLLKRPFGIFNSDPPFFYIYYEVVGRGSELLSLKKGGEDVTVLGPLGNGFPVFHDKDILMIGGGRGIVPLYFAVKKYSTHNNVSLVYGARSKNDLLFTDELSRFPLKEMVCYTDDGSAFNKGSVVTDIKGIIERNGINITFACGPDRMFESLNREIGDLKIENYVSLEALMGCGFGICHSCVVKGSDGKYKKVCSDGPVFRMEDIQWRI